MVRHLFSLLAALTVFAVAFSNSALEAELDAEEHEDMERRIDLEEPDFVIGEEFDENEIEAEARQRPVVGCEKSRKVKFTADGQFETICDGGIPNYPKPIKRRFVFRYLAGLILVECPTIRIRVWPGCRGDRLALFRTKGFNKGTRFCGRFDNFIRTYSKRVKIVFRSDPWLRTNIGFACNVTAIPAP